MKKLSLYALTAVTLLGFTACEADTDPKLDTTREFNFVLNTPPYSTQFIDLQSGGMLQFTVSQPDYGLTLAPTYGLEISLRPDFEPISDEVVVDSEGTEHPILGAYTLILEGQERGVLSVSMANVAIGINELNGIFEEEQYTEDYEGPVYVRATAQVGDGYSSQKTATTSNVVALTQVKGYYEMSSGALILCVPGNGNGWNNTPDSPSLVSLDGGATYQGFAYIDQGFKITDGDWSDPNWGAGDAGEGSVEGLLFDEETGTYSGPLIFNGGNINDTGAGCPSGLYFLKVEVITMDFAEGTQGATLTITPINSICVIGDYCGWDFGTAIEMTEVNSTTFEAEGSFTSAGWKFAFNGDWTINLGGSMDDLTFDGGNIGQDASHVTLFLANYPWTATAE